MAPMADEVLDAQDDLDRWRDAIQEHETCFQAWLAAPAGQAGKDWIGRELQRLAEKARDLELAIRERLALLHDDQVASVGTFPRPRASVDSPAAAGHLIEQHELGDDLPDPWSGDPVSMDLS